MCTHTCTHAQMYTQCTHLPSHTHAFTHACSHTSALTLTLTHMHPPAWGGPPSRAARLAALVAPESRVPQLQEREQARPRGRTRSRGAAGDGDLRPCGHPEGGESSAPGGPEGRGQEPEAPCTQPSSPPPGLRALPARPNPGPKAPAGTQGPTDAPKPFGASAVGLLLGGT